MTDPTQKALEVSLQLIEELRKHVSDLQEDATHLKEVIAFRDVMIATLEKHLRSRETQCDKLLAMLDQANVIIDKNHEHLDAVAVLFAEVDRLVKEHGFDTKVDFGVFVKRHDPSEPS